MNRTTTPSEPRPAGRWVLALAAALACLAQSALAQIGVPTAAPLTFDTQPAATEWSTLDTGTAGSGSLQTAAAVDAAIQTNVASAIITALGSSATVPPSANIIARRNTTRLNLQTVPTTVPYVILMATLRNDTGSEAQTLTISYDLGEENAAGSTVVEEVPGHRVFYSLTGEANSWILIPDLSGDVLGAKNAVVSLASSWAPASLLYILWIDDNAAADRNNANNEEGAYQIDNVSFSASGTAQPPSVTIVNPTNGQNIVASQVINVTTRYTGLITSMNFYLDGNLLGTDPTPAFTWTLDTSGVGTGSHTLRAVGTHATGTVQTNVTFNILANTGPSITITSPAPGFRVLVGTAITNLVAATDDVAVVKVDWSVDGNLVYTRSNANWEFVYNDSLAGTHTIQAVASDAAGLTGSASVTVTVTNPANLTLIVTNGSLWNYYASTSAPPAGPPEWFEPGYNWSSWSNGLAELGAGDNSPTPGDSYYPEKTVIDIGPSASRFRTIYFTKVFNLPEDPANFDSYSFIFRLLRDDGAIVYLNGFPVWTNNMPAGAIQYDTLASGAAGDDGTVYQQVTIPLNLLPGIGMEDNVVAVEVHQSSATSSDLSFDLMIWGERYTLPTVNITSPTNGTRVAVGDPVVVNVASGPFVQYTEFFLDGVSKGFDIDYSPIPPNFTLTIPGTEITTPGTHTLRVIGTDGVGNSATSAPVTINVIFNGDKLVATNSVWKYLDNGSDQGTAWTGRTFDDNAWASGPGSLGYGDPANTTVSFGPDANNKYITTYFRNHFNVANPLSVSNLIAVYRRDDGIVVYLNGTEVFRDNMPTGTILYNTTAAAVAADDGAGFHTNSVPPSLLVAGDNVIATEIHQDSVTSSDITMELQLIGNLPPELPVVAITSPTNGQVLVSGTVTVTATASEVNGSIARVEFYDGAALIGAPDTTAPYSVAWTATTGPHTLTAKAVDAFGVSVVSAPVAVTVLQGPERIMLVNSNSTWKYLDDSSCPTAPDWRLAGYNDGAWPSGPAQLGFGDGDEATLLNRTNVVTGVTNTAFYFRKTFNVSGPGSYTNLLLGLVADDGAIVYINGTEVWRLRMTNVDCTAFSSGAAPDPGPPFEYTNINPNVLVSGPNIVAVEVHQVNIGSSDVSFDLQLEALAPPGSQVSLQIVLVDHDGDPNTAPIPELRWSAPGFVLIQSSDPTLPRSSWTVVTGATSPYRPTVVAGATRYYALRNP